MSAQRQLLLWILAAVAASALLAVVLIWQHRAARNRLSTYLEGDPHEGFHLFQKKGCAYCHAVNGLGGRLAPDLGFVDPPRSSVNELVSTMWNHAPRMWERMRSEKYVYPTLDHEETADLFAYLYCSRYVDEPGDRQQGRRLFETKGCMRCHAIHGVGGKEGPDLSYVKGAYTPIAWTQAMWNHAPAMETSMEQLHLPWPKFEGTEMNDMLAYIRENWGGARGERELLPADPRHGRRLFTTKTCVACHSVGGEGGHLGPELGHRQPPAASIVQFAGLMWNHSPEMWRMMKAQGIQRPNFEGREMADLIAFLDSLRYFEPEGSPEEGKSLFARRGCNQCHGLSAEGTQQGPALRGRNETFNSIALAEALWRHGPKMYEKGRELGLSWPTLDKNDVSDLVVFLNTPPEEHR